MVPLALEDVDAAAAGDASLSLKALTDRALCVVGKGAA